MLSEDTTRTLAQELYGARRLRRQVRQFSLRHPGMTIEDGYSIQRQWVRLEMRDGRVVKGHKIGLTSRAMQLASGITEPDFAPLMDDMFFQEGADVPVAAFIAPRVEVELAFVLGTPLQGPHVALTDVLRAAEYVVPALEIIDARIEPVCSETKVRRKVVDTISDFAANAGVVMGGRPARPSDVDLRWTGAMLFKNGVLEETGLAAGVLNHPAKGVAWLANKIAPYGERLEAGEIVLAGSFTRPVEASAGDVFTADYGTLGSISLRFV
ncbi:MAG: 2-oxo-hepta-3-ene-1,7-dioic acid hydratase [Burkholderiales bacterium]|nr:2-oxo-hepta-3-ene-1,7-dioic acid hydratase [Burkholderiales bacterium]